MLPEHCKTRKKPMFPITGYTVFSIAGKETPVNIDDYEIAPRLPAITGYTGYNF